MNKEQPKIIFHRGRLSFGLALRAKVRPRQSAIEYSHLPYICWGVRVIWVSRFPVRTWAVER